MEGAFLTTRYAHADEPESDGCEIIGAAIGVAEVIEEAERLLWDAQAVLGAPPTTAVAGSSSSDA